MSQSHVDLVRNTAWFLGLISKPTFFCWSFYSVSETRQPYHTNNHKYRIQGTQLLLLQWAPVHLPESSCSPKYLQLWASALAIHELVGRGEAMRIWVWLYMDVSKNRGTPKWMVYNGESYQNGMIWGTHPYFWKHPYGLGSKVLLKRNGHPTLLKNLYDGCVKPLLIGLMTIP